MSEEPDLRLGKVLQDPPVEAVKLYGPRATVVVEALGRMMGTVGPADAVAMTRKEHAYAQAIALTRNDLPRVKALGPAILGSAVAEDPVATVANTIGVVAGRLSHLTSPTVDEKVLQEILDALAVWATSVAMVPPTGGLK